MTAITKSHVDTSALDTLLENLPAHIAAFVPDDDAVFAVGDSLPVLPRLSLRGKVWRYVDVDGTETPMVDEEGSPRAAIYVALVDARPNVSRYYFKNAYDPDVQEGAACFSVDGVRPHEKSPEPQAASCALCPMNRVGSKITEGGKKTRACGMKKDIVVAPCSPKGHVSESAIPVRLGLPAVSAFNLDRLVKETRTKSGGKLSIRSLVLKLTFNIESAFPEVQFTPVALLDAESISKLEHMKHDDAVVAWVGGAVVDEPVTSDTQADNVAPAKSSEPSPTTDEEVPSTPRRTRKAKAVVQPTLGAMDDNSAGNDETVHAERTPASTADRVASIIDRFKAFS